MIRIVTIAPLPSRFRPLGRCWKRPSLLQRISHGVLRAADGILHLAFGLVRFALVPQMGIARYLAGYFLYCALGLFRRAVDSVFIHSDVFLVVTRDGTFDTAASNLADRAPILQARKIRSAHHERSGG